VLRSLFILNEIKQNRYNDKARKYALLSNKNEHIQAHASEIINLHELKQFGSRKIANYLKSKYKIKISHTTIYKFLKNYKLVKEKDNG
jgi:IS30 family transposase